MGWGSVVVCYRCRHFIGMDMRGNIYCAKFNKFIQPMIICRFFEPAEEKKERKDQ